MRFLKQPLTHLTKAGLCVALSFAAPAFADEPQEAKPPTYVVTYQCHSGQFARVVTHDQKLSETIEQLSKGQVTAAQVLDYVNNNVTKELDKTIVFLDVCVGVKFRRT